MNSIIIIFEKTFISTAVEKKKKLLIKSRALASRPPFFLRDRKYLCDKLTMGECEVFNEKNHALLNSAFHVKDVWDLTEKNVLIKRKA